MEALKAGSEWGDVTFVGCFVQRGPSRFKGKLGLRLSWEELQVTAGGVGIWGCGGGEGFGVERAGRCSAEAPRRSRQMCSAGQGRHLAGLGLPSLYPPVCFTKFGFFAINSRLIKLFFTTWNGIRQAASHVR